MGHTHTATNQSMAELITTNSLQTSSTVLPLCHDVKDAQRKPTVAAHTHILKHGGKIHRFLDLAAILTGQLWVPFRDWLQKYIPTIHLRGQVRHEQQRSDHGRTRKQTANSDNTIGNKHTVNHTHDLTMAAR